MATELPNAIIIILGNRDDDHKLRTLLEKVTTIISRQIQAVTADKNYDVD